VEERTEFVAVNTAEVTDAVNLDPLMWRWRGVGVEKEGGREGRRAEEEGRGRHRLVLH
jgi:hypothetical protein